MTGLWTLGLVLWLMVGATAICEWNNADKEMTCDLR